MKILFILICFLNQILLSMTTCTIPNCLSCCGFWSNYWDSINSKSVYFWTDQNDCAICQPNFVYSGWWGNASCNPCTSTNCISSGTTATNCLPCSTTGTYKYFMNANKTCMSACPTGYYADSSNNCQLCGNNTIGYYVDQSGNCQLCDSTCYTCNGATATNCLTCNTGGTNKYFMNASTTCVSDCSTGYYADSSFNCQLCDPTCYTCRGLATNCSTCNATGTTKYFMSINATCMSACPTIGYYTDSNANCKSCDSTCYTCNGGLATNCLTCNTAGTYKYYMNTNATCLIACPTIGYYTDSNANCKSCDSSCYTCDGGFARNCLTCNLSGTYPYFMSLNKTCMSSCPTAGYYADSSKNCTSCDSTCYTCNGGLEINCLTCNTTKRLFLEASTSRCLTCSDNCTLCNGKSYNCTSCSNSVDNLAIFYLNVNITDPNTSYCRPNLTLITAGNLSLSSLSTLDFYLTFNSSLKNNAISNLSNLFSIAITNFTKDDFTYNISQTSDTLITFHLNPLQTIDHNILSLSIIDPLQILDNYSKPVWNVTNTLELGYYLVNTEDSAYAVLAKTTNIVASAVAVGCIPLILSGGMGAMWNALDILQMIYFYIFLNMNVPQNFMQFLLMFKFAQLPLPNIAESLMTHVSVKYNISIPEQPAFEKFADQNLDAVFLKNGASIIIYILLALFGTIMLQYIEKLFKMVTGKDTLKNILILIKWNFTIRYILTNALQLAFSASLQLTVFEFDDIFTAISSILAIISMGFLILFILWSIYAISLMNTRYNSHYFSETFGALTDGTLTDGALTGRLNRSRLRKSSIVKNYTSIIILRKISFVSMIVLTYFYPGVILIFLLIQAVLMAIIIYYNKPFQRDTFNPKNIVHEIMMASLDIILWLIYMGVITGEKSIAIAGYAMIGLCSVIIAYNLLFIIRDMFDAWRDIYNKIITKICYYKNGPTLPKKINHLKMTR